MLHVGDRRIRITIDESSGAIAEIQDLKVCDDVIKYPSAAVRAPFGIVCLDEQGRRREYTAGPVADSQAASGSRLALRHDYLVEAGCGSPDSPGRADLSCRWQVDAETGPGGASSWRIGVENNSEDLTVVEVVFPLVRGIRLGRDHADNVLVFPHHAGERIVDPAHTIASDRYRQFWRAGTVRGPDGIYSREINYCGLASMTWMDLYGRAPDGGFFGLYMASHDPSFVLTGVRSESGGPDIPWCGLGFRKHVPVSPGERWESAPFIIAVHDGDWHWGALQYRGWILNHISLPEVPSDLAMESAIGPRYDFKQNQTVCHRYAEIPEMYEQARAEGITHFFVSGWNRKGFDTDYPEFVPDMELGSSWDLARVCEYVRGHGGFSTFYINVRLFDLESDFFPALGRRWAIRNHDGAMFHETYGPRTFAAICPDCDEWRKWVADTAGWMVKAFGARGIYLDQLGSAGPFPCYEPGHAHSERSHVHHGQYNHGYLKMIREARHRIRALDPSSFLMIENCGDIYSQYLYANLTWNGALYDEFFNMYKYTFPEFIQVNMVNPRRISDRAERAAWFYKDIARAFVLGSVFWAELGDRFCEEDAHLLAYFRDSLRLRKQAAPYIARGIYQDDMGIAFAAGDGSPSAPAAITASRWILPHGGVLVLMSNPEQLSDAAIRIDGPGQGGWAGGADMDVTVGKLCAEPAVFPTAAEDDSRVTLRIPESELSFFAIRRSGGDAHAS